MGKGMSDTKPITGEMRKYVGIDRGVCYMDQESFDRLCDAIDAEHERQLEVLYRDMSDAEYVKLPKDADGEVWHVGDFAVGEVNPRNPKAIERMVWYGPDSGWQIETNTIIYSCPDRPRHYHAPTVEDVLREFALKVAGEDCMTMRTGVVEEYAAKLREVLGE